MSIVMGIDPGSRFTGYGIIAFPQEDPLHVDHGVIVIPERLAFHDKLKLLSYQLSEIYLRYAPSVTVVEKIFLGRNADSAFKLGQVRGVCLLRAAVAENQVFEYATRSVKKSVTGTGAATKEHVRSIVMQLLGLRNEIPMDATDALAMALCHSRKLILERRMQHQMRHPLNRVEV